MLPRLRTTLRGLLRRDTLARGAGAVLAIQALRFPLAYAAQVLLARWMGVDGYGAYVLATSWTVLAATLGGLGLPTAVLRFVPSYRREGEPALAAGFVRFGRRLSVLAGLGLGAVGVAVVLLVPMASAERHALAVGFAATPLLALVFFLTETLRALERPTWAYVPMHLLRPALTALAAGALVLALGDVEGWHGVLGWGLALAITVLLHLVGIRRDLPMGRAAASVTHRRGWLQVALPLLLVQGFSMLLTNTDVYFLGALMGAEEVGLYNAAMQTAQAAAVAGFAVDAVAAPALAGAHAERNPTQLQHLASRLAHLYFWPTLLVAFLLAVAGRWVLQVFGDTFVAAQPVLLVLILMLVVNAAFGSTGYLLALTGHERRSAGAYAGSLVLAILLNVVLIPNYGLMGAAWATLITRIAWNAWLYALVVRHLHIRPSIVHALLSS